MIHHQHRFKLLVIIFVLTSGLLAGLGSAWLVMRSDNLSYQVRKMEEPKTIVAAGDISCSQDSAITQFSCKSAETATLINSINPDAVLTTGDNQYPTGSLADYQNAYDETWGTFKDKTYPVPGNHEYQTPGAAGYFDYFGPRAGERGKGYYTFNIGDWKMFALNSEIDISEKSGQIAWLKDELNKDPRVCTLAFWHKPRFSTGGHPDDKSLDPLWRVLHDNDVDVVVNGHSHSYERYVAQDPNGLPDPKGITQIISGLGGQSLQSLKSPVATLASRQNHSFGVVVFDLYSKRADFRFASATLPQTFTDQGSIACH